MTTLQLKASKLFPLPIYGNSFDPDDFKFRENMVKEKRKEWIKNNKQH